MKKPKEADIIKKKYIKIIFIFFFPNLIDNINNSKNNIKVNINNKNYANYKRLNSPNINGFKIA